jgi:DNA-binding Lrp family transcriptional regulator
MKNSKITLNNDEKKVIEALEKNAKENIETIAKKCGFSRQKVWRIIKNLEKEKIIWGYSTVSDEEVQGMKHFILIIKRSTVPIDTAIKKELAGQKLSTFLPDTVKVEHIYLTHGAYGGVFTFYAPDLMTAKRLVQTITNNIGFYFDELVLLETLFPIRKSGLRNPHIKQLVEFL